MADQIVHRYLRKWHSLEGKALRGDFEAQQALNAHKHNPRFRKGEALRHELRPAGLDGDASQFSLCEQRTWDHFLTKHGLLAPDGGHVVDGHQVTLDLGQRDLASIWTRHSNEARPTQWVFVRVSDWDALAMNYGAIATDFASLQDRIRADLESAFQYGGKQLNIRFTFEKPDVAAHKTIYVATAATDSPGQMVFDVGEASEQFQMIHTFGCTTLRAHAPNSWVDQYPRAELAASLERLLLAFEHDGVNEEQACRMIWPRSRIQALMRKVESAGFSVPQSAEELPEWLGKARASILAQRSSGRSQSELSAFSALRKFHHTRMLLSELEGVSGTPYTRASGWQRLIRAARIATLPAMKRSLSILMARPGGSAQIGCDEWNYGNLDKGGLMLLADAGAPRGASVMQGYKALIDTMVHETAHLMGLQHHYKAAREGSDARHQATMVAGPYASSPSLVHRYSFREENARSLFLMLGYRDKAVTP